jgi:hypothetical protein
VKIAFFLSSLGGSPLQSGLCRGLQSLGHTVEDYEPFRGYDIIVVWNQTAHNPGYAYPPFPAEHTPIVFIDSAEYGWMRRMPETVGQYANAFAPGSVAHDTKNRYQQERLREFLEGRSFPYMIREYSKHLTWPSAYHPIDYPLYYLSEEPRRPDREEFLKRPLDLFMSWCFTHPYREHITAALRECPVQSEIHAYDWQTTFRYDQSDYFSRQRTARCGLSFDGYGSSSFRLTEVLVRSCLLVGPLSINRHAPLIDGETCIEYGVEADGDTFTGTNVCEVMKQAAEDPERAYRIYEAGYDHCYAHYTERATAQYVLDVVGRHDWGKVTPLHVVEGHDEHKVEPQLSEAVAAFLDSLGLESTEEAQDVAEELLTAKDEEMEPYVSHVLKLQNQKPITAADVWNIIRERKRK